MDDSAATQEQDFLDSLRQQRAELLESLSALETALAAPAPGRVGTWAERVHVALVELSADFGVHIDITEGADGFYRGLLAKAPRLSNAVSRLTDEHTVIKDCVEELMALVSEPETEDGVDKVRDVGTALLGRLIRHRQRGSDLVYEAYQADIGGET